MVGNAPGVDDQSADIDAHDRVIRFNNACGLDAGRGSKLSDLVLINCGGQMKEWLSTDDFTDGSAFSRADRIVLPIPPEPGHDPETVANEDAANYAREATERFEKAGKEVLVLPPRFEAEARVITGGAPPSTGLIILHWLLTNEEPQPITCFGFGFAGWSGHDFDRERNYFRQAERRGLIRLTPPGRLRALCQP
ncbi:hypothetical protein [Parvularcula maris]|uniref:Uncharacterized protein n=1 Tax=Parvularcula maris TaxID=2965077 RepID=A0A9X2RJ97_9PROT|nr:hypothetical protein [Parvularcula maris]MCQ8184458.1 hypothetical protein [Parvularcula maris]